MFIYITNLPANKQFETSKNYCVHTFAGQPNLYYQSGQAGDNLPGDISASMYGVETKAGLTLNDLHDTTCMTPIGFQILMTFTLSCKLFIPSS